ncbi:MAG: HAMP domain-containing sensor histidine kinase, partial [Wenzhouxiangellaceae bacterium]|nr:HAMP domain-containing sensor histidine kinase [Wenzhouxiangellaceae bacterium]
QGTRRLNRILQAMSQAARLEESLIDEPFERFDLAALAADYCATRRETCGGVRLECERPPRPVPVNGSPDLVAQLLDKLVDNALGFTPTGGGIDVRVEVDGTTARLEVENDGPRIDEAGAGELFDPMVSYRQSAGETPHLGLGLFIARLIAERHGGRMSARPTRRGSAFRFEMPCADD